MNVLHLHAFHPTRVFSCDELAVLCKLASNSEDPSLSEEDRLDRLSELHVACQHKIEEADSPEKVHQLERLFKHRLPPDSVLSNLLQAKSAELSSPGARGEIPESEPLQLASA